MKKNVLFLALETESWMGGLYYIKNQIGQLLRYAPSQKKLKIYLYTSLKYEKEYIDLMNYTNIKMIFTEKLLSNNFIRFEKAMSIDADILYLVYRYHISYIFPYFPKDKINKFLFLKKSISWIPDFQHIHLPHLFSISELNNREKYFGEIAREHNKLVLSSHNAYNDYLKKYPSYKKNVYVIPFCSVLNKKMVKQNNIEKVKSKYGILGNYFIVCNQFWMHKNHMLVFKALKSVLEIDKEIRIVCTGNIYDYRNKRYIHELKEYINNHNLQKNIQLLGLVEKEEQIQLLKGAIALIQPSLFEGWGTCVEDAKTLKKRILLSDIEVHHEQMNIMTKLFDPFKPDELASLMLKLWKQEKNHLQNSGYSLKDAKKYGELFYKMLLTKRKSFKILEDI